MWGAPIPLENARRPLNSNCDGSVSTQGKFMPDFLVPHVSFLLVLINLFLERPFYRRYAASGRDVAHSPANFTHEYYNICSKKKWKRIFYCTPSKIRLFIVLLALIAGPIIPLQMNLVSIARTRSRLSIARQMNSLSTLVLCKWWYSPWDLVGCHRYRWETAFGKSGIRMRIPRQHSLKCNKSLIHPVLSSWLGLESSQIARLRSIWPRLQCYTALRWLKPLIQFVVRKVILAKHFGFLKGGIQIDWWKESGISFVRHKVGIVPEIHRLLMRFFKILSCGKPAGLLLPVFDTNLQR